MDIPETRYAKTADGVYIAYQIVGNGPMDLAWASGFASANVEVVWEHPLVSASLTKLASMGRLILHDRRGTGLSDRATNLAGQESKFRLVYQSTVVNSPLTNVSNPPLTLPVTNFDLRGPNSYWDDAVGGHTNPYPGQFETGIAALWSGVTGTGTVTITLHFTAAV